MSMCVSKAASVDVGLVVGVVCTDPTSFVSNHVKQCFGFFKLVEEFGFTERYRCKNCGFHYTQAWIAHNEFRFTGLLVNRK